MSNKAFYATFTGGKVVFDEPTPQIPEGKRLKLVVADEESEPLPSPKKRVIIRVPKTISSPEFKRLTPQEVHDEMAAYAAENAGVTDQDPDLQEAGLEAIQEKP